MDDVINVTGHRLGTAEVEDVMVMKPFCQGSKLFFLTSRQWDVSSRKSLVVTLYQSLIFM
jgi:hypothetical protein